jgi:hypothetical protein
LEGNGGLAIRHHLFPHKAEIQGRAHPEKQNEAVKEMIMWKIQDAFTSIDPKMVGQMVPGTS